MQNPVSTYTNAGVTYYFGMNSYGANGGTRAWYVNNMTTDGMFYINSSVRIPGVTDGTSNTFLFGERYHLDAGYPAINTLGGSGLWCDDDGFYYDQLHVGDRHQALRVRSLVGLIPLIAAEVLDEGMFEHLEGFREHLCRVVSEQLTEDDYVPKLSIDGPLLLDECNEALVQFLDRLSPFGIGNTEPLFIAENIQIAGSPMVVSRNHLKLNVRQNGRELECIGFGMGHLAGPIQTEPGRVSIAFVPTINVWQNRARLQLKLRDVQIR